MKSTQLLSPRPTAIDKLRLSVRTEQLRDDFVEILEETRKQSTHIHDCRAYDLPLVVIRPKQQYRHNAPLLFDVQRVGELCAMDIVEMIRKVVICDPLNVGVSGVDFTADWFGGNVALFWRLVNVRSKRNRSTFVNPNRPNDDYETKSQSSGATETLYYGSHKSGDFYRIYDKAAQLEKCGGINVSHSWTRVERHLSGRRSLPRQLNTLRGLLTHGASFSPFLNLEISPNHSELSHADVRSWRAAGVTPSMRRNVFYLHNLIADVGRAEARKLLRVEGRVAKKELDLLDRALREIGACIPDMPDFNLLYKAAFAQQMWPNGNPADRPSFGDLFNNTANCSESPHHQ